ncbi:MAG: helix-turn-helix domain-containing protein [Clostridia bacterium]|nr:helix-turn-helix domain-containing protein [Clostridia bacterium]
MSIYMPEKDFHINYKENTIQYSSYHFHNVYEMTFFLSGSRTYLLNNSNTVIMPHNVILIKPFTYHSTLGSSGVSRYVILFSREFLNKYFSDKTITKLLTCFEKGPLDFTKSNDEILQIIKNIYNANEVLDEFGTAYNLGYLLFTLCNMPTCENSSINSTPQKASNELMEKIFTYINNNISEIKTIAQIANFANISQSYLSAIFRQSTGLSIMQYVNSIRINFAAKRLVYTNDSISQISADCGFDSPNYFCNTFKKSEGLTPSQFRKSNNK